MTGTKTELVGTEKGKTLAPGFLLAALVAAWVLLAAGPAHAATFAVNSTGDRGDQTPGDGRCFTGVVLVIGEECTLRAAISEANASPGADTIAFDVPTTAVATISPASPLPALTGATTIDGYTQGDAAENTLTNGSNAKLLVELNGAGRFIPGLTIRASNCVIRGLAINGFSYGVDIGGSAAANNRVAGNFVGTDPTGTVDRGNFKGLAVFGGGGNNVIGGTVPAARNVISGNGDTGIQTTGDSSPGSGAGNVIQGNLIGTKKDGATALGNDGIGVAISTGQNTIGGNAAGSNTIAFNGSSGVQVSGVGNAILANSAFSNGRLGIDLGGDGVTPNDESDPDSGPNALQNFPGISSAVTTPAGSTSSTTVKGGLNSTPNRTFTLRFFSSPAPDASGFGEGKTFLGRRTVTTNANGNAAYEFVPARAVPVSWRVTATATGASGTSEFSRARIVVRQV